MILLQSLSKYLLQILATRLQNLDKGVELDCHWIEFDDVRYHIQASIKNPNLLFLSMSLPTPPPETKSFGGLPPGAIEAIKAAYGVVTQILDPAKDGFSLTLKLNLSKLPPYEGLEVAYVREVVLGAPLRVFLKQLASRTIASNIDKVVALEFVDARRTAGLNNAPPCSWSQSPPSELKGAPVEALSANAGFVSFVIFPRHVEGRKLDRTVWGLLTFHAYVSYHVKCSEAFMHTCMRCRVESLIQALDRAKPDLEKAKKVTQNRSFKRLSLKDGRSSLKLFS